MRGIFPKYLSSSGISVFCFILSLLAKIGLLRIFLDIGPDKFGQILIARNLLQGHGLSVGQVSMTNLAEKFYVPAINWPPGYSFLVSPFLLIWKDNFMVACFAVDCLTAVLFFWYLRKTLLLINFPVWLTNLFMIFQGFFINDYIANSSGSDFLGMTLLLAAIYYIIEIIGRSSLSFKAIFSLSIFLVASSITRYQYLPIAILLLSMLTGMGILQKKKYWWQSGLIALCIVGLVCGAGMIYQQLEAGSPFYLRPAKKEFFPGNLQYMYPFTISSFINLHFYAVQLSAFFDKPYGYWMQVAKWLNWPVLVSLIIVYICYLRNKKFRVQNRSDAFWVFGGMAGIGVTGLLILLSLVIDNNIGAPLYIWTYVMDGRYYAFPVLFIQVCAWQWLHVKFTRGESVFKKWAKGLFIIIVLIEVLHGIYFLTKKYAQPIISFSNIISADPEIDVPMQFIKKQQKKDPSIQPVITSLRKLPGLVADWYGAAGLFTPMELNNTLPESSQPAVLLVVIRKKDVFLLAPFFQQPGVQLLRETTDFSFYTYYVGPASGDNR